MKTGHFCCIEYNLSKDEDRDGDIVLDAATVRDETSSDEEDSESLTPDTAAVTGSGLYLLFSVLFIEDINSLDLFLRNAARSGMFIQQCHFPLDWTPLSSGMGHWAEGVQLTLQLGSAGHMHGYSVNGT